MFDVFYSGTKPNLFPHEQSATDIDHAKTRSRTRYFWWINYLSDYSDFDFLWEPVPWQADQRHVWASQWQKDSGTYLIPNTGFTDTNYHATPVVKRLENFEDWMTPDGIEEWDYSWHPDPADPPLIYQFGTQWQKTGGACYIVPNATIIKYVTHPRVNKTLVDDRWTVPSGMDVDSFDWTWHPDATDPPYNYQFGTQHQRTGGPVYIVPGATDTKFVDQIRIQSQQIATAIYEIDHLDGNAGQISGVSKTVRYFDNYFDVLKRIAKNSTEEFIWICSSVCDYSDFDFSWHPEQWQASMLHVFASDSEKFGDTFFMHVPTFLYRSEKCQLLEWYDLNFVSTSVPRRPMPVIKHTDDTHVDAVKTQSWQGPLALFTTSDVGNRLPTVPLWREKTKTVVPLDTGAESVIVPRTAIPYIKTQVYDYPYIDRSQRILKGTPLDIVFISNSESMAEENWEMLNWSRTNSRLNRIVRVDGVKGRVAAYHAAAEASTTPWFFAVFAKLRIVSDFDWTWQPDRLQEPKHYIFHACNPVNGLVYGHQAMIAYNKKLTLANSGTGLDFTLDSAHEVVPILSGDAMYCEDPWTCWRTAFREALKLRASLPDVENEYRLKAWLKEDSGAIANGHWSHKGAQDAMDYYDSVNGDFDELKKSYDWEWLYSYAFFKRNLSTGQ
jgi:hypothetical protein